MVTFGEFIQHVLTGGLVMAVSLVVLVIVANRYDDGHGFLRKAPTQTTCATIRDHR